MSLSPSARSLLFAALCAALIAALASCATVQEDLSLRSATVADEASLTSIDAALAAVEAAPAAGREELSAIAESIDRAYLEPMADASWKAALHALRAELALVRRDMAAAARAAAMALELDPSEPRALLVAALALDDLQARSEALERAVEVSGREARLLAELGLCRLAQGRAAEAVSLLDEALPFLGDARASVYAAGRAEAWALREEAAVGEDAKAYVNAAPASFAAAVTILRDETGLLAAIAGGRRWAAGALFERLKGGGFLPQTAAIGDPVLRRDLALLLWLLLAERSGDRSGLLRYTRLWGERGGRSPVPDLAFGSPWFDAVLGCVEAEIMDLPDGASFMPDAGLTGIELFEAAKRAEGL